jgi:rod shape-determining protein MreD
VTAIDGVKAVTLLFVAAIVQVTIVGGWVIFGGTPDLLLVTLVSLALVRGVMFGATCGFFAGLVVDTAYLQPLGLTSLLLTLAGYWTGRYGETTGRDRGHAPLLSVAVITLLYTCASFVLRYILGEESSARVVFVESLVPTMVLNVLLVPLIYALVRRLLPAQATSVPEVQLLG